MRKDLLHNFKGGMHMSMTKQMEENSVKRDYKSRMFTMIFKDKKELLQLNNAVGLRNNDDPELLTINTLDNAIYMNTNRHITRTYLCGFCCIYPIYMRN